MEKEDKEFMMEETVLDSENQGDGEISPAMKNIVNGVTDMLTGTLNKRISNPNAGRKSLSDIIGEAARKDNEDEENDEETE